MRKLVYVPIIHTSSDMGSLAQDLEIKAKKTVKATSWEKHKAIINNYWVEIARYWKNKNVSGFKIFQDGMPVNGKVGKKIVVDLAKKGSFNYKIIEQLMKQGAILMKTEDQALLKEEYFLTRALVKRGSFLGSLFALLHYKWRKGGLLAKRDNYIAKRIDEGLQEGETGICFLGAYHQIKKYLSQDIKVIYLYDPQKVKVYYQRLIAHDRYGQINWLGSQLIKPITISIN